MTETFEFNDREFLIEQIKRVDTEGVLGTPIRYWINQQLPAYLQQHCPAAKAEIVDLGCGSGLYAGMLRRIGITGRYLGLDLDAQPAWEKHVAQNAHSGLQCAFKTWDVHDLAPLGRTFNFALAVTSFEHFTDDKRVMAEVGRVLQPGGKLIVIVPSHPTLLTYGFHGKRRYGKGDGERLAAAAELQWEQTVPICGLPSFLAHLLWFNAAWIVSVPFYALLKAAARWRPGDGRWSRYRLNLNNLQFTHLNTAAGRRIHAALNRTLARADRRLPWLPSAYLFVFAKAV